MRACVGSGTFAPNTGSEEAKIRVAPKSSALPPSRAGDPRERELCTDHLMDDIGHRTARGGVFLFTAQAIKVLAQCGAMVILARLLPPSAFGLVAMTTALNAILEPLKELGLSSATIQKPDITHDDVSTLFWINVGVGLLIAVLLMLAAPVIAHLYQQPELIDVTRWLAVGFIIGGLGAQHWALLRRQMRLRSVALMELGAEVLSFAVAIALAVYGAGYWALVAQRLVSPLLVVVGGWTLCRWRPGLPSHSPGLKSLFAFGASVTTTTIMGTVARNIDQVLIGLIWGPFALGLYERASKLLMVPINNIFIPLYSVGMPTLSRLTDQELRYRTAFAELLEKLVMITMPTAAFVLVTSDWITDMLFGAQWHAAAPLVGFFGLAIAYYPSILALSLLYLSQNRPAEMLRATFVDVGLALGSIVVGLPFGVTAVAACLAVVGLTLRLPTSLWLATRTGPVRLQDVIGTILPSVMAAFAVGGALWAFRVFVATSVGSPAVGMACAVAVAVAAAATVFWALPRSRRALRSLMELPRLLFGTEQPASAAD